MILRVFSSLRKVVDSLTLDSFQILLGRVLDHLVLLLPGKVGPGDP